MKKSPTKKAKKTTKAVTGPSFINFVLDETGSMDSVRDQTISGFNEYVNTLRKSGSKIQFSLMKFNSGKMDGPELFGDIKDVPELTRENYVPDWCTPLYDAIGRTIKAGERALAGKKKKQNVLVVIMTDGYENESKEYTQKDILSMIKEKEKEGWTFVYLGANQDAWAVGSQLGMSRGNTVTYQPQMTGKVFANMARSTVSYCASASPGQSSSNYFDEDSFEDGSLKK